MCVCMHACMDRRKEGLHCIGVDETIEHELLLHRLAYRWKGGLVQEDVHTIGA